MLTPAQLTTKERQVAALLAQRLTTKQIAARLAIGPHRVNSLTASIARKLGVSPDRDTRIEIYCWWWEEHARPTEKIA